MLEKVLKYGIFTSKTLILVTKHRSPRISFSEQVGSKFPFLFNYNLFLWTSDQFGANYQKFNLGLFITLDSSVHWELPVNGIGWIRVTGRFFLDFSFSQQHVSINSYLVKHYRLLIYLITMVNVHPSSRSVYIDQCTPSGRKKWFYYCPGGCTLANTLPPRTL